MYFSLSLQDSTRLEGAVLFFCFWVHSLLPTPNFAITRIYNDSVFGMLFIYFFVYSGTSSLLGNQIRWYLTKPRSCNNYLSKDQQWRHHGLLSMVRPCAADYSTEAQDKKPNKVLILFCMIPLIIYIFRINPYILHYLQEITCVSWICIQLPFTLNHLTQGVETNKINKLLLLFSLWTQLESSNQISNYHWTPGFTGVWVSPLKTTSWEAGAMFSTFN